MANAESIPRYEELTCDEPRTDEPDRGSCWNCKHGCGCRIHGVTQTLCARERDAGNGSDLEHITMPITDCPDWVHFEA